MPPAVCNIILTNLGHSTYRAYPLLLFFLLLLSFYFFFCTCYSCCVRGRERERVGVAKADKSVFWHVARPVTLPPSPPPPSTIARSFMSKLSRARKSRAKHALLLPLPLLMHCLHFISIPRTVVREREWAAQKSARGKMAAMGSSTRRELFLLLSSSTSTSTAHLLGTTTTKLNVTENPLRAVNMSCLPLPSLSSLLLLLPKGQ